MKSILIVDDNPSEHLLADEAAKLAGLVYPLRHAYSGVECLETGMAETPSLILLDLRMPDMDGFQVLSQLKSNPDYFAIPTVILSSSSDQRDIKKAYKLGCDSYIAKPVDFMNFVDILKVTVEYWLETVSLPYSPKNC